MPTQFIGERWHSRRQNALAQKNDPALTSSSISILIVSLCAALADSGRNHSLNNLFAF